MEPRSGFATRGGLGEEAGGWVGIMLIINIVIPEEDFHGVRAISTTQARSSLQQEGSASSLYMFPSHTITAIDLLMGSLQPLDTFSCNFHTHPPPPRPKTRPFPNTSPMFSFQLNPGFSNYPVGQYKSSLSTKSQGEISAPVYISLKNILQLSRPLPLGHPSLQ